MEKKEIKLEVVYQGEIFVAFRITKQTHREEGFGIGDGDSFVASNGLRLSSAYAPCRGMDTLWMRGCEKEKDDTILEVSKADYAKITEAVKEYNEYFHGKVKLTTKIFNHPDCPKDARIAIVNESGWAFWGQFTNATPDGGGGFYGHGFANTGWIEIPGKYDGSDYPNTIIRNPKFEQWKPKHGEAYWTINFDVCGFGVEDICWCNDEHDTKAFELGLVFKTHDRAEAFIEAFRPIYEASVKDTVKKFNEPLNYPDVT